MEVVVHLQEGAVEVVVHLMMEEVVVVEELLVQVVVGVEEDHLLSKVEQEVVEVGGFQNLHSLDKFVFQSCVFCTPPSAHHPLT